MRYFAICPKRNELFSLWWTDKLGLASTVRSPFQIENMEHCDFIPLRNMLVRTHLQDLKDVTNNVHYENYRCRKLAGVAGGSVDKIPNRVSSSSCFKLISAHITFWSYKSISDQ